MAKKTTLSQVEALLVRRLIKTWTSAQDVIVHLESVMRDLELLNDDGSLNVDRVRLVEEKAKE